MTKAFTTQTVADGVWRIEDSRGGVMYLVAGEERALLIDTGWGAGDLHGHIATLTPLPIVVVNTHGHPDHVSGNGQFPQVYIHTRDLPLVEGVPTRFTAIYDGYSFDLGNREICVIGVPGHSPGSICLLDREARILFSGDSPRPGPIWLHLETSLTVQDFHVSLSRLRGFADHFDVIAPSHGKPERVGSLLDDLAACAGKILSGELVGKPQQTRFGECLLGECGNAGITYRADRIRRQAPWAGGERIVSPEVHADRTVTFSVRAARAGRVLLISTPVMNALGSADSVLPFQDKDARGIWSLTIGPLPPDIYDYLFLLDDVAVADPNNPAVQTGVMAPRSLLTVPPDDEPDYHAVQDVPHGTLHRHYYRSEVVGDVRDVCVYTPPGYDANPDATYPVLYLLHGIGDDAGTWSETGRAHWMVDNLLARGKARPMIIVMPLGHALPLTLPWKERREKNTSLLEQDLFAGVMPLVESTYRTVADRTHRAIAGLSMGGAQTDSIGLGHLDTFSCIGILSAAMDDFERRHADLLADPVATNKKLDLLFLGCGTLDLYAVEGMSRAHELLMERDIDHVYRTLEGAAHTWIVWRSMLYKEFLPLLWRT